MSQRDNSRFGEIDGYSRGIAGGWDSPLPSLADAHKWLGNFPPAVRRNFARGFAEGVAKRLDLEANRVIDQDGLYTNGTPAAPERVRSFAYPKKQTVMKEMTGHLRDMTPQELIDLITEARRLLRLRLMEEMRLSRYTRRPV